MMYLMDPQLYSAPGSGSGPGLATQTLDSMLHKNILPTMPRLLQVGGCGGLMVPRLLQVGGCGGLMVPRLLQVRGRASGRVQVAGARVSDSVVGPLGGGTPGITASGCGRYLPSLPCGSTKVS